MAENKRALLPNSALRRGQAPVLRDDKLTGYDPRTLTSGTDVRAYDDLTGAGPRLVVVEVLPADEASRLRKEQERK